MLLQQSQKQKDTADETAKQTMLLLQAIFARRQKKKKNQMTHDLKFHEKFNNN